MLPNERDGKFFISEIRGVVRMGVYENFQILIFVFCLISEGLVDMKADLLLTWRH